MHQALYRKWRPKTFSEVVGQDHVTKALAHEAKEGMLSHAYLFCGSRGTGKTTCAKILAKAANCKNLQDGNPCNACEACLAIDAGTSLDVLEMDAASNTGVDYIRDIRDEVIFTPAEMGTRVYIIDEVHMLSEGAFNALLKTLEEPPSKVIFILATTELQKIPATILSRCQRFDFRRIPVPTIMDRLSYIASQEGIDLTEDGARLIARLSQGGMRDAVSLLELCYAGDQRVDAARVAQVSGTVGREGVIRVVDAVQRRDYGAIFDEIAKIHRSSCDLSVFFNDLSAFYRDMMVQRALKIESASAVSKDVLDVTEAELADLSRLAANFRYGTMVYHSKLLEAACLSMSRGADKRITAELTLLRMCGEAVGDSNEALSARIDALDQRLTALSASGLRSVGSSGSIDPTPAGSTGDLPADPASIVSDPPDSPEIRRSAPAEPDPAPSDPQNRPAEANLPPERAKSTPKLAEYEGWPELIERFATVHPAERPYLQSAQAQIDESGTLYVNLTDEFSKLMLENVQTADALRSLALSQGEKIGRVILQIAPPKPAPADPFDGLL